MSCRRGQYRVPLVIPKPSLSSAAARRVLRHRAALRWSGLCERMWFRPQMRIKLLSAAAGSPEGWFTRLEILREDEGAGPEVETTSAQPGLFNIPYFRQCLKPVAHTYAPEQSCFIVLNCADAQTEQTCHLSIG